MKKLSLLLAFATTMIPSAVIGANLTRQIIGNPFSRSWNQTNNHGRIMDNNKAMANIQHKAPEATEQSVVWGWCEEADFSGPFPAGWYCNSVIGFPTALTNKFDGCYVKSIIVCKGYFTEENPLINLFLTTGEVEVDPEYGYSTLYTNDPFMSMNDVPFTGAEWEWVEFELPEPYLIKADSPFYAGWGYLNTDDNNCPLVSDMVINNNLDSSWMEGYDPADPYYGYWNNCTSAGANCIRLRITGDNLPSDDIVINSIDAPRMARMDEDMNVTLSVSNAATDDINSVEISYAFAGTEAKTMTIDGLSIAAGEKYEITLNNIAATIAGNVSLDIEITSVNGKNDADYTNNMISTSILCLPEGVGYERKIVVEEGTGTWCGNCPRGMVGMEEMAKKYPDNFIGIAAHSDDPMAIDGYAPYLNRYINVVGYPYCTVDRVISDDPEFNILESNFLREASVPALADVRIEEVSIIDNMVSVSPSVKFAVSEENTEYGWAYVITEDNVGPYPQTNYYTDGSLPGWDHTNSPVVLKFNEVACAANDILGVNSIPATTIANESYSHTTSLDASAVKDFDNARVIVMIINMKTGYIENAVSESFKSVGIDSVNTSNNIHIEATRNSITLVSGADTDIFTISGQKAGSLKTGETITVENGIYLAKTGGKTYKLFVR